MKTRSRNTRRPFELKLVAYGNCYYIDRVARLERALARSPRTFQIDLVGAGEIPADAALLIRSVLLARSPKTHLITRARSSLQNGSVLVWLLGDTRLIRDDARLFFRRATLPEDDNAKEEGEWNDEPEFCDSYSEIDPEEGDHARALECINAFLPVKELAGRLIEVPVLRQFGLVENEKVDHFLATAFGAKREPPNCVSNKPARKHPGHRNAPVSQEKVKLLVKLSSCPYSAVRRGVLPQHQVRCPSETSKFEGLKARRMIAQGKRSAALGNQSKTNRAL